MGSLRTQEACRRSIEQDGFSEWLPTYRLDQRIAEARERMGEDKWKRLNSEWEQSHHD